MNIGQSDAVTIGEYNEQGELMRGYYYSPQNSLGNAPVAIKHNDNGITQTSYYQNDHLNTPQMLTRPNGAIVWQGQYDAFGEVTQTNTQVSNPLRFPGQYQDDETGLHYNWHRYYDNSIGRYVTSDPIGLDGGINTYSYANSNPLKFYDPTGEAAIVIPLIPPIIEGLKWCAALGMMIAIGENCSDDNGCFGEGDIPPNSENRPPPADAYDPEGAKAPGKPGSDEGFVDPPGGDDWAPNPNGPGNGRRDADGNVWVPTGHGGRAHGGPHCDVQRPRGRGYENVYPGGRRR